MPQVSSLFTITGNAGGLCFFKANDKTFVRKPTSLFGDRWWAKKTMRRAQERAHEFGGASQAASHIRSQFPLRIRKITHRYSHNHLAMAIRRACQDERSRTPRSDHSTVAAAASRTLSAYSATGIANAITGRQLGNAQGNQQPIISTRHTAQSGLHISIHGLRNHADTLITLTLAPAMRVDFRIHICYAIATDIVRDPHSPRRHAGFSARSIPSQAPNPEGSSSQWATLHGIDPITDRLDLPAIALPDLNPAKFPQGSQLLVFIAIEWRQRTGKRIKNLHSMSTVEGLLAVPISAHPAPQPGRPARIHTPKVRKQRLRRQMATHRMPVRPKASSHIQRLKAALATLAPPG